MSLRLLAGPFDVVDGDGNPPTYCDVVGLWWPEVGYICTCGSATFNRDGGYWVMTLDGVVQNITSHTSPSLALVLGYWADWNLMAYTADPVGEYTYDPYVFSFRPVET